MTTETKPWRAEPIPDTHKCFALKDPTGFEVATIFDPDEAVTLPERLNALEACAEVLASIIADNSPEGMSLDDYEAGRDVLARLDALRP
jgi:hypothetical protein